MKCFGEPLIVDDDAFAECRSVFVSGFHQQVSRIAIQCCVSAERDGRVEKTNYFESSGVMKCV